MENEKAIYIVLNKTLSQMEHWRMPNVVTMLGMMMGTKIDDSCVGPSITDASGITHAGIGNKGMPILAMEEEHMVDFYKKCKQTENESDIIVFDFPLCGQNTTNYALYQQDLAAKKTEEQVLLGVALYGDKKLCRSLCGSLRRW
jgi:hypothetical protein